MALGAVLALSGVLVAAPAAADLWYEHYARAENALADGRWERVVRELNEALARRGDSGARVRTYGMRVVDYFPYLKLGIAYYNLGQLEAAEQAFETEEQLGAIRESEGAWAELTRYRRLVRDAREEAAETERLRVERIVSESLREADRLEAAGRLGEAMDALGRGLAVDPSNPQAQSRMERLREEVARRLTEQVEEERVVGLVARGRELLAQRDFSEAAGLFRQAVAVRPGGEAQRLLEQAQEGLRGALPSEDQVGEREVLVAQGLSEAQSLAGAGSYSEALDQLESVLVLDPSNPEAEALQASILARGRESAAQEAVERALTEAGAAFAAGQYEASLSAANRALALDSGNARAVEYVRSAYREISVRVLGSAPPENIPPAIRFADFREDTGDGLRVQTVRDPAFRLSGVVIDSSPVDVLLRGTADEELPVSTASQPVGDYFLTEFSLQHGLPSGVTVFKITATDIEGLSSSSEYSVQYVRPFFRSPWFLAGLFIVPLAVSGTMFARWRLRRRELLHRRYNPYIAGAPVLEEDLFVGRERLLERILETIHNNSLLLYGERRIGKTSIQHHLKRRLTELDDPEYAFFPVLVDLQGVGEERFFATLAEDIFAELESLLGGVSAQGALADGSYGYRELVADLRAVLAALKERSSKRVKLVLLIDEVDELNAYDPRVNQKLRSLFMKSFAEHLVAVVSGVEISRQWDKEGSPWYNFFEEIEVGGISKEAAKELIKGPVRGVLKVDNGVVERICELSDCKPYRIQKLCVGAVNRVHAERRRSITLADVEAAAGREEA